ncbi:MAG TPA: LptF/LptG family permease [Candidatus Krumholzibacteriaceae bacterium]|nr:LptF/LptG family permease [Candidatus Krumholzibacteriaceae bacterium]
MKMNTIDKYVLKNHITPYLFGFSIITFIFIMDFLYRYLDLFIGKGINFLVAMEFFILSLGHMFALIIPMSVMPATLMAFGQLASDNEITAMKSSGISLYRIILPVLIASLILTGGLVYFNNYILPESNHKLLGLMIDIGKMKPTMNIKENIFCESIEDYTLLIQEKNDKTGTIKGVQIFQLNKEGIPVITVAEKGKMKYIKRKNLLQFELENGEIHKMPNPDDVSTYRKTHFEHYTLSIQDSDRDLNRTKRNYRGDREMNIAMMKARIREINTEIDRSLTRMNKTALKPIQNTFNNIFPQISDSASTGISRRIRGIEIYSGSDKENRSKTISSIQKILKKIKNEIKIMEAKRSQIARYKVEIHKKYSIAFSCTIFILIGAPLALLSGKKGITMAIGFSLLFFVIYYIFLIGGEKLADRQYLAPWLAMWLPNIIFTAISIGLIHMVVNESKTINWEKIHLLKQWRKKRKKAIL